MSIFRNAYESIKDTCYIWADEMKQMARDEGVIIFFVVVPLIYPLLYSWIYNNEVVHEVPVVVVDQSHTSLSRQFIQKCNASPDVNIKYHAEDMDEAKMLMSRQVVRGIYLIPSDFETRVNRLEQATVSVYCDMSMMMNYKAIFQTALAVSTDMGNDIKRKLGRKYTVREEQITAKPLDYDEVAVFNPAGGYGSSILPAVLMLIIQQTLVLGIGMSAGTSRESNRYKYLIPISQHYHGMFRIVAGKALAYFMIYAVLTAYLALVVPWMFDFPSIGQWQPLLAFLLPYLLACIFFGIVVSCIIRYRENVMLLIAFVSVPLLFLSGVSWPQSNISPFWQSISWIFPSTFGIRGYTRLNVMGGNLSDVVTEYSVLWIHTIVYFILACLVYRYQIYLAKDREVQA